MAKKSEKSKSAVVKKHPSTISNQTKCQAAQERLMKQIQFQELRAEIWKLASDRKLSEGQIIKIFLQKIGEGLDLERVAYSRLSNGFFYTAEEWRCNSKLKSSKGLRIPKAVFKNLFVNRQEVLDEEKLMKFVQNSFLGMFKPLLKALIKIAGNKPALVTTYTLFEDKAGAICCAPKQACHVWTKEEKSILAEAVNILQTIMERDKSSGLIRDSEERYKAVFEASDAAVYIHDAKTGKILEMNSNVEKLFGFTREEIMKANPLKTKFGKSPYSLLDAFKRLKMAAKGIPQSFDWQSFRKDGTMFWSRIDLRLFEIDGKKRVLATVREITEQISSQMKLQESEEKFRSISEQSLVAIAVLQDGLFKYFNEAFAKITGYSRKEISNWPPEQLFSSIHPEDRSMVMQRLLKRQKGEDVGDSNYSFRAFDKSNNLVWLHMFAKTIIYDGRPASFFMQVDVTAQHTAEERLKESEENYKSLADQELIGIMVVQDGAVKYANRGMANITKSTIENIKRMPIEMVLEHIPPELRDAAKSEITATEKSAKPVAAIKKEVAIFNRFKEKVDVDIYVEKIIFDGRPAVRLTFADITELKRTQSDMVKLIDELTRSNAELEQFAFVASHDLQAPLRQVSNYVQLLKKRYDNVFDADAKDFMRFIVDGTTDMRELINDVLSFSRAGSKELIHKNVDVNEVLLRVKDFFSQEIEDKKAKLNLKGMPTICCDEALLTQLFQNLIGNAIKFNNKGAAPVVEVSAELINNEWVFAVKDNGIGIDKNYFNKIFLMFQRLHAKGEFQGTGIGLAICDRIVKRYGGRIWVQSEPGKGASFYFTLSDKVNKC